MARTPRLAFLWIIALVAACLFSAALITQNAGANVNPTIVASYPTSTVSGAHSNFRTIVNTNPTANDDIKRMVMDYPAGLVGDPNAIAWDKRCTVDYRSVTPDSGSPNYTGCPDSSVVGTVTANATSSLACFPLTLTGKIYLLKNQPNANPEVPTRLGISLTGTAWVIPCFIPAGITFNLTAEITLRQSDNGLRITILDNIKRTDPIIGGAIQVDQMDMTVNGMAPAPSTKPFLTNPTRCDNWTTSLYARAWDSNSNVNSNIDGTDYYKTNSTTSGSCSGAAAPAHGFTLTQTNTKPGAPVGLRAVMTNVVPTTNALQPPYAKTFALTLPVGFRINPAIGARLGGPGGGCTEAQFLKPDVYNPVTSTLPTCPASSQVGNVAVTVPEVTGDLTGRIYLGEPRPGDVAAGIYRLYITARDSGGGIVTKFQGTSTVNPVNGQVTVTIDNDNSYADGLPQFNFSKFDMDFNSNSAGIGSPSSGPVSSPNDAQQMLVNPQWCGSFNASATMTQWSGQSPETFTPTLTTAAAGGWPCAFNAFDPSFTANLDNVNAGQHPNVSLEVARADRTDNIEKMVIKFPEGMAGSVNAAPICAGITQTSLGSCGPANALGTADVVVGYGSGTINMATSTVYNVATDDNSQTAKLAIVTPASVGPFNLGNVISYSVLKIDNPVDFRLISTTNLTQSINGIPIPYRSIKLNLVSNVGPKPFLVNPSATCGAPMTFDVVVTSNGDANGSSSGPGTVQTAVKTDANQNLNCTASPQPFTPTFTIDAANKATAQPTPVTMEVSQDFSAATTQQSTIRTIDLALPVGFEMNPGFASATTACPTATVDADRSAGTNTCAGVATQIASVEVKTPLLPPATTVAGQMYLEQPGSTPATRYRFVLYLEMPGGRIIVRGGATVDGSSPGGVPGGLGSVNSGTGQIVTHFIDLPDVAYSSMKLTFDSPTQMFVNPPTIGTQTFNASFTPWSTSSTPAAGTASYITSYDGTPGSTGSDPWNPTFSQTVSTTAPNAHPDVTMTINRPEKNQQLASALFKLPSGLTGAVAAVPTCTQAQADAVNCPASSRVGSASTIAGSALVSSPNAGLATLSGGLYNTEAPAGSIAKLTAMINVVLGPFDLGSMSLPVNLTMRPGTDPDPYGLNASVTLPYRYEGVRVRYRSLAVTINGVAPGNGANFMTNPSQCAATKTTTAQMTSDQGNVVTATQQYTTDACGGGFGSTPPNATVETQPVAPANQSPVGQKTTITNPVGNPTLKRMKLTFPPGMTINPAVGNYGPAFTCDSATINASLNGNDACDAAGKRVMGTVSMTTPLLSGTFTGKVYLETPAASGDPDARYRMAMIVSLPGQTLIIRGKVRVDGDSTVPSGATGSTDSGTGQITVDFDNLPDLAFSSMVVTLESGDNAQLVTPTTCSATNTISTEISPHTNPFAVVTLNSNFNTQTNCNAAVFSPTLDATLSSHDAGANPTLTLDIDNPGTAVKQLRTLTTHLPAGFVANTSAATPRCTQAQAAAANCPASSQVGTVSSTFGPTATANYTLTSGKVYNVDPAGNEPARLQTIIPVTVGPFDLGNMTVPITTSIRTSDNGVDTSTTLPHRYEGIDVYVRNLTLTLGGANYLINPSECGPANFTADFSSLDGTQANGVASTTGNTIVNCDRDFSPTPSFDVTPTNTGTAQPTGLTFSIGSTIANPTIKSIDMLFPEGMEFNPAGAAALGSGGSCPLATVQTNPSACPTASAIGGVDVSTPLLTTPLNGTLYLVTPGTTATTRYRTAVALEIPGRAQPLVVEGSISVDGSTTIPSGGLGSIDTNATGRISTSFTGLPDFGFTSMVVSLVPNGPNAGNPPLFVNKTACTADSEFSATLTPHGTGDAATVTDSYTTDNNNCTTGSGYTPDLSVSPTSSAPAAHPDLTFSFTRPDYQRSMAAMTLDLPTGLVAATANAAQCTQAVADAGNCATTSVGSISTTFGSGTALASAGGTLYNVTPDSDEPARFQAIVPISVGPFDLGKLSVPVHTTLRSDFGVTATADLPVRYEGISVRMRTLEVTLLGSVGAPAKNFVTMPSKCGASSIGWQTTSNGPSPVNFPASPGSKALSIAGAGCSATFAQAPTLTVSPTAGSTTQAAAPANLTFNLHSDENNSTIKRVAMSFPDGMEINPGFANNAAASELTCPSATIDAITTSDDCATSKPSSKIADVTLVTPLIATNPTGAVYLESPGSTASTRYRVAMVIKLPGRYLVTRGSINVPGSTTIAPGATGAVGGAGGPISADFDDIPDLGFTDLTLAFNSAQPLVVNQETCTTKGFSADFYPWSSGIKSTATADWTATGCGSIGGFDPSFDVKVNGTTSAAAASHPDLTMTVGRADGQKTLGSMTISLPQGIAANTGLVANCSAASANDATCATTAPYSQVGTFVAAVGSGANLSDAYTLSGGKLFQTDKQSSSEAVRFTAVLPVQVGPYDLGNLTIPVSGSIRSDYGIDVTTQMPTRYEGITVRVRKLDITLSGSVQTGPSETKSYSILPSKCGANTVSASFTAGDSTLDSSTANNSASFTTTGCTTSAPAYDPSVSLTNSPTTAGAPTAIGLHVSIPQDNSTTNEVKTEFPVGMELNPGSAKNLTACSSFDPITGPSCPNSSLLGSVTLNTPLLPTSPTGGIYVETPGAGPNERFKLVLAVELPGRWLIIHGAAIVGGSTSLPGGVGSTADTGAANGRVTATFPGLPDLGFTSFDVQFKSSGPGANVFVNPKTCSTSNTTDVTLTPTNTAMSAVTKSANFTTENGTCGAPGFSPTFSGSLTPSPAASASHPNINLSVANPVGAQDIKRLEVTLPTGLVASTTAVAQCTTVQAAAASCPGGTMVGSVTTTIGSSDTLGEDLPVTGTIYNAEPASGEVARLQVVIPVQAGPYDLGSLSIPVHVSLNQDMSVTATTDLPSRYEGVAVRIRQIAMTILGTPNGNNFVIAPSKCQTGSAISAKITSDAGTPATIVSPTTFDVAPCNTPLSPTPGFNVASSSSVRGTPTNLTFTVNNPNPANPTIGKIKMTLPDGMEVNPAFANNLTACDSAAITAGASSCPASSQVGTVSMTTPLLTGSYTGNVYMEAPGNDAATRYRMAIVVDLPGQKLVVRGSVTIDGTTDIPTAATGATGSIDQGGDPIVAEFNNIPDLAFSQMIVAFNSTNPMLVNPTTCQVQTFQAEFTPNTSASAVTTTGNYSTTPNGCMTEFNPTFTATTSAGSSIPAGTQNSSANPSLKLHVDRPADNSPSFENYLRDFNLELPAGMVAATTATSSTCSQADAAIGNCTNAQRVGTFATGVGSGAGDGGSSDGTNLYLAGGIYNVTPSSSEVARMAAITQVSVGPYNLGKLVIPITTQLRSGDYGVNTHTQIPKRYEGIAVRIRAMDITLNGWIAGGQNKPFMVWPSKCASNTITANMTSDAGDVATGTATIDTNSNCTSGFANTPTLSAAADPTTVAKPTGLDLNLGSTATNKTVKRVKVTMPSGMSINPAVGNAANGGNDLTCPTAAINAGGGACPADSRQGTVTLNSHLLQAPASGSVYLETPTDMTANNRYRMAIVVDLPGATDLILHGIVKISGSSDISGGTGATGGTTGTVTAEFSGIPDLGFTNMDIALATGAKALLVNPDSCGTQTVSAEISPTDGGPDANVSGGYSTTGNGPGCVSDETFSPSITATATDTTSGANTDLDIDITPGITTDSITDLKLHLPVGLVASTTATDTRCTQAQAAAATCTAASKVGTIDTEVGTGASTLALSGTIHNVVPGSDEPARLAAIVPVVVGPYNLGKLSIPVSTELRSSDYGVDAEAQIPATYEGITVRIASMQMHLLGVVDQGTPSGADDKGFIKNPSKCDETGADTHVTTDLTTARGRSASASASYPVTGCPKGFSPDPTLTVTASDNRTMQANGLTLEINSSAGNPTISSVVTTMPLGMTLNPVVGKNNGMLAYCEASSIAAGGGSCPAGSKVGDVTLVTPLLPGQRSGEVFIKQPGSTAADRYQLAIVVHLPGSELVVNGTATVDGASDITGGVGATDTTGATGRVVASFDSIPDLGFTQMTIEFASGDHALFTNGPTPGAQQIDAVFTPTSGGATAPSSGSFTTVYGGSHGSPASDPFSPTFGAQVNVPGEPTVNETQAAGNPNMTLTVARSDDWSQQIRSFDLHLPPGLVANTVDTPRCPQAQAASGSCPASGAASTRVGSVTTEIGTGGDSLAITGDLFNVEPDSDEPARLSVSVPVVVGPYNLGRLNLPVETEIVSGASAADLAVDTHTVIPQWYEGVPVRIREMQITVFGTSDAGKPYMISPSRCATHTIAASMTAPGGDSFTSTSPNGDFETVNCDAAPYEPTISASATSSVRGKPVGLDLGFSFSGSGSSTKKIVTTLPEGMAVNPGVGNYGAGMTCDDALVEAGGTGCPVGSNLGSVTLDTPLLPDQRSGAIYLLPPVGDQAATRYRLGLFVDLPGSGDLYTEGSVNVDGSSDVPTGATGRVDGGTGQVTATFDNLPDLQFSNLTIHFKTTDSLSGSHALLTNPPACGSYDVTAEMFPWAWAAPGGNESREVSAPLTVDGDCAETEDASVTAEIGDPNAADFNDPYGPSGFYDAGTSQDVTLTVNRPDTDRTIKRTRIVLPAGLVGSADAAPTCATADAEAGNCETTEPNSRVGTVTLQIGDSSDSYEVVGNLYNVVAPSDRPAKLSFASDINVGPFHLGKVVVPIDVNLDPDDYHLIAETGDMPQVFEGIPVRISQMKVFLMGKSLTGSDFMINPHSCTIALKVGADVQDSDSQWRSLPDAALAGPFQNCDNLNLDDDVVTVENTTLAPETGHKAEHPTGLSVQVDQNGSSSTQATLDSMALALPGFRLNAAAADGLGACSASQLDAQNCPANSLVGKAWLDTPLLPADQDNPFDAGDPTKHSLWGRVYLATPGSTAADRYKLAIQMTGKTLITLRGTAVVDEDPNSPTYGDITTTFSGLPDIPFSHFRVELTGNDSGGGFAPLLLNPARGVGQNTPATASASLVSHNEVSATRTSDMTVDPPSAPKGFAPTTTSDINPLVSGAHPDAKFTIARPDGDEDIKTVAMQLPAGFLGSAAAVPLCSVATAAAGNCSSQSKVGTVEAEIGQFGQTMTLPGTVYLTEGVGGDIAGMSIKVAAEAGPYNLGDYITQGRILIRPSDHGITVTFDDVPRMFKGVPTHIKNMDIDMPGVTDNGKPFLYNASSCDAFNIATTLTPYAGAAATDSDPYQVTGCPARTFSPSMSFQASGGDERSAPAWTIKMGTHVGDSTLAGTQVTLPSVMTVNVAGLAQACTVEQAQARACPASAQIGTVSINTPLLTTPVTGTVYMAKSISGESLPDLLMEIPEPINMQIRGANSFVNVNHIQSTFIGLPDLIFTDLTMQINGGPTGLIGLRSNGECGSASTNFSSHSGQQVNSTSPIMGLEGFCGRMAEVCANPAVKITTKGAKKKGYKKSKTSITLNRADNCQGIKSVRVTYPKGFKFNKKLIKYKKTKNKKRAKVYKKNLKNLTGRADSLKLTAKDFRASGKTLKIKPLFPAGTRSMSINTKNGALALPYKTFCGKITKSSYKKKYGNKKYKKKYTKALKKCKDKKVTFRFDITNADGTTFRYDYAVPAGSKFFK